jgi:hypothetical protein
LLDYDWKGQKTKHRAYTSLDEYAKFKQGDMNIMMCGGVGGRSVKTLVPESADMILMGDIPREDGIEYYVSVEWEESYYESAKWFLENTVPDLKKIGLSDDVRIVFWFDN